MTSKREFKAGDRVRVQGYGTPGSETWKWNGVGTVIDTWFGTAIYRIKFDTPVISEFGDFDGEYVFPLMFVGVEYDS